VCSCEVRFLVPLGTMESLHKSCPGWIYPIGNIVTNVVLVSIDNVFQFWCCPGSQTLEKWRTAKHIDIVERTRKTKKGMCMPCAKSINLEMQQPQESWSAHPYALCMCLSKQPGTCPTSGAYSQWSQACLATLLHD